MKFFQLFTVNLVLSFAFVISINAQIDKPQIVNIGKIAVINFDLLRDEKTGIKEFADIYKKFDLEFESKDNELKPLYKIMQHSLKELQNLKNSIEIRVTEEFIKNLVKQYDDALYKYERKLKEVKTLFDKRKLEVDKEAKNKIAETIKSFAKEKGYAIILNSSQNNILVESETIDATDEFIKFYNNQTEKKLN